MLKECILFPHPPPTPQSPPCLCKCLVPCLLCSLLYALVCVRVSAGVRGDNLVVCSIHIRSRPEGTHRLAHCSSRHGATLGMHGHWRVLGSSNGCWWCSRGCCGPDSPRCTMDLHLPMRSTSLSDRGKGGGRIERPFPLRTATRYTKACKSHPPLKLACSSWSMARCHVSKSPLGTAHATRLLQAPRTPRTATARAAGK